MLSSTFTLQGIGRSACIPIDLIGINTGQGDILIVYDNVISIWILYISIAI